MKKILSLFITCVASALYTHGQSPFPSYKTVLEKFYTDYSSRPDVYKTPFFARKIDGWYIDLVDPTRNNYVVSSHLFWSATENRFVELTTLAQRSGRFPQHIIDKKLSGYDAYCYERCRYYGYNEWDRDMINDFGNAILSNDTLYEGLARAYSNYASRYSWYQSGGEDFGDDSLQIMLGRLEFPSEQRLEKIRAYSLKSIELYRKLAAKNPYYTTLEGAAAIKMIDEQMTLYLQLKQSNREQEAKEFLLSIKADSNTIKVGHNYLNACAPNSILITVGDHDTFPLWYVQEKENFRKDVTVLNYSLLAFPPYLNLIKREGKVKFSTSKETFGDSSFDFFLRTAPRSTIFTSEKRTTLDSKELLSIIQTGKFKSSGPYGDNLISFPANSIALRLDTALYRKNFKQKIRDNEISWDLPEILLLNEFIIFDIIDANFINRPICFTFPIELFKHYSQFEKEGIVYRLGVAWADMSSFVGSYDDYKNAYNYFAKYYKPVITKSKDPYYYGRMDELHLDLYYKIIQYYVGKNDNAAGKMWSKKYLDSYKNDSIPFIYNADKMAVCFFRSGMTNEAIKFLENMSEKLMSHYKNYKPVFYVPKKMALEIITLYNDTITSKKFESKKIKAFLAELLRETD